MGTFQIFSVIELTGAREDAGGQGGLVRIVCRVEQRIRLVRSISTPVLNGILLGDAAGAKKQFDPKG